MRTQKSSLLLAICVILFASLLSSCSEGWDGGEFAGQPVYDLTNKQFSVAATEALKSCGMNDGEINTLAETLLPNTKEISGSLSGMTITYTNVSENKDIADISLEGLTEDYYKVTCIPST